PWYFDASGGNRSPMTLGPSVFELKNSPASVPILKPRSSFFQAIRQNRSSRGSISGGGRRARSPVRRLGGSPPGLHDDDYPRPIEGGRRASKPLPETLGGPARIAGPGG